MLAKLKQYLNKIVSDRHYRYAQQRAVRECFNNVKDTSLPELTAEEKFEISRKWSAIIPNPSIGFHAFRVFKKYDKFNSSYVPEPYFYPYIIRILNPTANYISLPNKGLIDSIFSDVPRPTTIIKRIGSNLLRGGQLRKLSTMMK